MDYKSINFLWTLMVQFGLINRYANGENKAIMAVKLKDFHFF